MRILFLSHRHSDTQIGGLAEYLHHLPTALKTLGVDSILYTQAENKSAGTLQQPNLLPNSMPHYSGPFLKPGFFISKKELSPLIELCKDQQINLIHAQGTYRAGYMAMHLNRSIGIPYLITSHSDILETNSERMKRHNIKKRCQQVLKKASLVTHLTPIMAEASHQLLDTRTKSRIIHNGIDIAAWDNPNPEPEQNYLLAIGRLEPEKGFSVLIDAYAELLKKGQQTSLVIAGTGSAEADLKAQAERLQLNIVTGLTDLTNLPANSLIFTGYVRAEFKKRLFNQAIALLFATQPNAWEEAFGIVQLEAMVAGKPIIASDIAATQYLKTLGMQADIVQAEKTTAWTNAMAAVLQKSALERQEIGLMNKEAVRIFNWDRIAKEYVDAYQIACR